MFILQEPGGILSPYNIKGIFNTTYYIEPIYENGTNGPYKNIIIKKGEQDSNGNMIDVKATALSIKDTNNTKLYIRAINAEFIVMKSMIIFIEKDPMKNAHIEFYNGAIDRELLPNEYTISNSESLIENKYITIHKSGATKQNIFANFSLLNPFDIALSSFDPKDSTEKISFEQSIEIFKKIVEFDNLAALDQDELIEIQERNESAQSMLKEIQKYLKNPDDGLSDRLSAYKRDLEKEYNTIKNN